MEVKISRLIPNLSLINNSVVGNRYSFNIYYAVLPSDQINLASKEELETIVSDETKEKIKKFTKDKSDGINYSVNIRTDDETLTSLTHRMPWNACDISIKTDINLLNTELHNGSNPNESLFLYAHAFPVLVDFYKRNNIDPSFLPAISFENDKIITKAPFELSKEKLSSDSSKLKLMLSAYNIINKNLEFGAPIKKEDKLYVFEEAENVIKGHLLQTAKMGFNNVNIQEFTEKFCENVHTSLVLYSLNENQ